MTQFCQIHWTVASKQEAQTIIEQLLKQRLIACASIISEVLSLYRWEGKINADAEVKVIIKTQSKHFDTICSYILQHASYQTPEVAMIPIEKANPAYLQWLEQETDEA